MHEHVTHHDKCQQFPTGALRSDRTGKGRYDLISPLALKRLALLYERGALQKGARNWEGGFEISRCVDAIMRHTNDYREGKRDEDHLAAIAWNAFAAMHFEEMIKTGALPPALDDMPRYRDGSTKVVRSADGSAVAVVHYGNPAFRVAPIPLWRRWLVWLRKLCAL